jgi:hypothetical protein
MVWFSSMIEGIITGFLVHEGREVLIKTKQPGIPPLERWNEYFIRFADAAAGLLEDW